MRGSLLLLAMVAVACGGDSHETPDGMPDGMCVCDAPPPSECADASTLRTFAATGTCGSDGACSYAPTDTSCPGGCDAGACVSACTGSPSPGSQPGAECIDGTTCTDGSACNESLDFTLAAAVPLQEFTGSMCGDVCDPNVPDTCGPCAACSASRDIGRIQFSELDFSGGSLTIVAGRCRASCVPDPSTNGGCRAGYTCDLEEHVCRQACLSDAECNLVVRDGNIASEAGPWTCNTTTGRCEHGGTSGAVAGDACTADSDCMANGTCFTEDFGGGTAGFCARNGCTTGFECGGGEECSLRGNPWAGSWCLPACTVGAEPESDVLGIDGHGLGCAVGHSCHWAGADASPSGGCFPGNYNAVATPNVGGACQSAADCYSPFGYGNCLFEALTDIGSGMCSVQSCTPVATGILPNVTTTTRVCDPVAEICVGFASEQSQCLSRCTSAASCAPGYACNDSILSGGLGVCWPNCQENGDCRVGVTCIDNENPAVVCDADGPDNTPNTFDDPSCYCADRTTR